MKADFVWVVSCSYWLEDDEEDEEHLIIEIDKHEAKILEQRKAMAKFKAIMNDTWYYNFKQEVLVEQYEYGG